MLLSLLIGAAVLFFFMLIIPSGARNDALTREHMIRLNQQDLSQIMSEHVFNTKFGVYDSSNRGREK